MSLDTWEKSLQEVVTDKKNYPHDEARAVKAEAEISY
jgi:hypothetical protein